MALSIEEALDRQRRDQAIRFPRGVRIEQWRDHRRDTLVARVMIPNALGRPEPLIDETGKPVNLMLELGNPEKWSKDRSPELEAIARRVLRACTNLAALRQFEWGN
jgi:hypothetical protein